MYKLFILLIGIFITAGFSVENFAQSRYSSNYSYKPKSFRTNYKSSGTSLKYTKRTFNYKPSSFTKKHFSKSVNTKFQRKINSRPNTKLNFPKHSRNYKTHALKYRR